MDDLKDFTRSVDCLIARFYSIINQFDHLVNKTQDTMKDFLSSEVHVLLFKHVSM